MSLLTFDQPMALIALLLIPLLILFYLDSRKKGAAAAMKFSKIAGIKRAMGNKKHSVRLNILFYVGLAILALMVIGFADPNIPLEQAKEGINVVMALDVSGSMKATDYQPNRGEAMKRSATVLIDSLEAKDNVGIVVFESGATTAGYLSPYKERVREKLMAVQVKDGATAIGDGLALSIDMAISIPNKKKVVILLSDGVNNAGVISPAEAVGYAKANKIQVFTIGMGSDEPVVLGYDFFGRAQYADLDEATLKAIAAETGGKYFRSVDEKTLEDIYSMISDEIDREREPVSIRIWLFALALLLLLGEFYLRYGRFRVIQ